MTGPPFLSPNKFLGIGHEEISTVNGAKSNQFQPLNNTSIDIDEPKAEEEAIQTQLGGLIPDTPSRRNGGLPMSEDLPIASSPTPFSFKPTQISTPFNANIEYRPMSIPNITQP
jgi:hypothetical protein